MNEVSTAQTFLELGTGTLILVLMIFVHGAGIRFINRRFESARAKINSATPYWRADSILGVAIGSLAALHLAETLLWALPIYWGGFVSGLRDSYYFVMESYTTLGASDVSVQQEWRLLGPLIAISGMFTFSWTAGVLVSIMTEFGKLDRARAGIANTRAGDREG